MILTFFDLIIYFFSFISLYHFYTMFKYDSFEKTDKVISIFLLLSIYSSYLYSLHYHWLFSTIGKIDYLNLILFNSFFILFFSLIIAIIWLNIIKIILKQKNDLNLKAKEIDNLILDRIELLYKIEINNLQFFEIKKIINSILEEYYQKSNIYNTDIINKLIIKNNQIENERIIRTPNFDNLFDEKDSDNWKHLNKTLSNNLADLNKINDLLKELETKKEIN